MYFDSPAEFISIFNQHNDTLWEDYRQGNIKKEELRYKRFKDTFEEKEFNNNDLSVEIGDLYMEITPRLNTLFPNTIETLEYLAPRGYEMYILTNGFLKTQEIKLENVGIGLNAMRKGKLIHEILENVWKELETQERLLAMSDLGTHLSLLTTDFPTSFS